MLEKWKQEVNDHISNLKKQLETNKNELNELDQKIRILSGDPKLKEYFTAEIDEMDKKEDIITEQIEKAKAEIKKYDRLRLVLDSYN